MVAEVTTEHQKWLKQAKQHKKSSFFARGSRSMSQEYALVAGSSLQSFVKFNKNNQQTTQYQNCCIILTELLKAATMRLHGHAKVFRDCAIFGFLNAKMLNLPLFHLFWVSFQFLCLFLGHLVCAKLLNGNIGRKKKSFLEGLNIDREGLKCSKFQSLVVSRCRVLKTHTCGSVFPTRVLVDTLTSREFGKLLLPSYLGTTCMETTTLCNTRCNTPFL